MKKLNHKRNNKNKIFFLVVAFLFMVLQILPIYATIAPKTLISDMKRCFSVSKGAVFFLANNNVLWAGGTNSYYRLGVKSSLGTGSLKAPQIVDTTMVPGTIVDVDSGNNHTLILDDLGNVFATGYNAYGQIGNGNTTDSKNFVRVTFPIGASKIVEISTSANSSFALDDGGNLYAWGKNNYGELGDGTTTSPVKSPKLVFTGVKTISASKADSTTASGVIMALKTDGSLWMAGYGGYYQFGDNTATNRSSFTNIPLSNFENKEIKQIASYSYTSIVLTTDGTIYTTGTPQYGSIVHSTPHRWGKEVLPPGMTCTRVFRSSTVHSYELSDNMIWANGSSDGDYGIYFGNNAFSYFVNPVTKVYFGTDGVVKNLAPTYSITSSTDNTIYGIDGTTPIIDLSGGWDECYMVDADGNLRVTGNTGLSYTSANYYDPINSATDRYKFKKLVYVVRSIYDPVITISSSLTDSITGFPINPSYITMGPKQYDSAVSVTEYFQIWNADLYGNPTTKYTGIGNNNSGIVTSGPITIGIPSMSMPEGEYTIEVYRTATAPVTDPSGGGSFLESNHRFSAFMILNYYTVNYDGNGNTTGSIPAESGTAYLSRSTVPVSSNTGNLEKTGFVFDSWNTMPDGSGTSYLSDGTALISPINSNLTLYAIWEPISSTVTFDVNSGDPLFPSTKKVIFGSPYGILPNPTKYGYIFGGWYTSLIDGSFVTNSTIVANDFDHTLYATWLPRTDIEVTYDPNGGDPVSPSSKPVTFDEAYGILPGPLKTGYDFNGWFTASYGGDLITETEIVTNDLDHTLYAHWSPKNINVTFNLNGSGEVLPPSKIVIFDDTYGELPVPTRYGYIFDAWYSDLTYSTLVDMYSTVSNADDHTLYARWEPILDIVVNFNINGGDTVSPSFKIVAFDDVYGELPIPTRLAYDFDGWYTDPDYGILIDEYSIVSDADTHTLYAHWSPFDNIVVTFDINGGDSVEPTFKTVTYDDVYHELPIPIRFGYDFDGWFTEVDAGDLITETVTVTNYLDHILHAKWSLKNINVVLDSNGGDELSPFIKVVIFDSAYGTLPTPTRYGYNFTGWFTDKTYGTLIDEFSLVSDENTHALYAGWSAIDDIVVNFDSNGGDATVPSSKIVTFDDAYGTLPTPTRYGYNFTGWFLAGGDLIDASSLVSEEDNHVLFAYWSPIDNVIVSFNSNGGNPVIPSSKTVIYDSAYGILPNPTRNGYTFGGWYTSLIEGDFVANSSIVTDALAHTLYATWLPITDIEVIYDTNGGSPVAPASKSVTFDELYGTLPGPLRTGYDFNGWFTERDAGDLITEFVTVTDYLPHTLYAHWSPKNINVAFNSNGGGAVMPTSKIVIFDAVYGTLPIPTRIGYNFTGWFTDRTGGDLINASSLVSDENVYMLYARWSAVDDITVEFDSNGGGAVVPHIKTVTYDLPYGILPEPTRDGYTFGGWYTSLIDGDFITNSTLVTYTSNHILYAIWSPITDIEVTYEPNGGEIVSPSSKSVTFDDVYGILPGPLKTGYDFNGWFTESTGGDLITKTTIVKNYLPHTLYAKWSPKNINVIFNLNGGNTVIPPSKIVIFDAAYGILPTPTRTGYNFTGWFTDKTDGDLIDAYSLVSDENVNVLYARWSPIDDIAVNFDSNGGDDVVPSNITVTFNAVYGSLPTPTRYGHKFNGWYTAKSGGNLIDASSLVSDENAHVLYAKWSTIDDIVVSFDSNGGDATVPSSKVVTFDTAYGTLPTPARYGYNFTGWFTDKTYGTLIEDSSLVSDENAHTLYANWSPIDDIVVSFDSNGGDATTPSFITVEFDTAYGTLPEPTYPGFNFDGWYLSKDFDVKVDSATIVSNALDHTLYANWNQIFIPTLIVEPNFIISKNANFDPKSIIIEASDKKDGLNLIDNVVITGSVDISKPGPNFIHYVLTNSSGNTVTADAVVDVVDHETVEIGDIAIYATNFTIYDVDEPKITDAEIKAYSNVLAWNLVTGENLTDQLIVYREKLRPNEGVYQVLFRVDVLKATIAVTDDGFDAAGINVIVLSVLPQTYDDLSDLISFRSMMNLIYILLFIMIITIYKKKILEFKF